MINRTKKMGYVALATSLAIGLTMSTMTTAGAAPPSVVVYDSIGANVPGNVPSQPFQAQQTSEFGDRVVLAAGPRNLTSVTVLMSSWGCETGTWFDTHCQTADGATFNHPLTLTIYNPTAGLEVGPSIITKTQIFAIPFRPSADPLCMGVDAGKWMKEGTCFNGFATPVTFTFSGTVSLPDDVVWGISFNTSSYGANPIGPAPCSPTVQGCPYDSLNVGLSGDLAPTTGIDVDSNGAYLNSHTPAVYCNGALGVDTFRSDTGCWLHYRPMAQITTGPAKDQCKNDGWKTFNNPSFKNQGDCVSYMNHNGS